MMVIEMAKKNETVETVEKTVEAVKPAVFTKDSLLKSKRFANRRDALSFLLKDEELYTMKQVEALLENFFTKGQVN